MKLSEQCHPECLSNKDADLKCNCAQSKVAQLEEELDAYKDVRQSLLFQKEQLEAENPALKRENEGFLQFATFLYGMGADAWPEGAWDYYQAMPVECAKKMDALLADTQESE